VFFRAHGWPAKPTVLRIRCPAAWWSSARPAATAANVSQSAASTAADDVTATSDDVITSTDDVTASVDDVVVGPAAAAAACYDGGGKQLVGGAGSVADGQCWQHGESECNDDEPATHATSADVNVTQISQPDQLVISSLALVFIVHELLYKYGLL